MNTPTGTRRGLAATGSALLLATTLLTLNACRPEGAAAIGKRIEAKWEARQLLVVGDGQTGIVRIFHTRAAPVLIGELRAPGRASVRDIRIDEAHGRIWVLGETAVYLHDARSGSLIRRIPASAAAATQRLELETSGALRLLAEDGTVLARVEPTGFSVEPLRLAGS
ncbi:MAG: hypothetical protein HYU78_07100 [Rhodocyclales bacterium]|nr:hypothetical protein [Rhodocyclales bacterium]